MRRKRRNNWEWINEGKGEIKRNYKKPRMSF